MLTPRENLLKAFNHEQPEWIPVSSHVDPYAQPNREGMDPDLEKALGTIQWGDGSTRILTQYLGLDMMDFFSPQFTVRHRKVKVERIDKDGGWVNVYKTPRGDLQEVHKIVREDGTAYCVEHLVKSGDDLKALACIFEDAEYSLKDGAVDYFNQRKALVGDQGLTRSYMPGTPLGMMVRVYSGVETLAYLWADYRDELHQLFRVMEEQYVRQFELAASLGYDLLFGTDDTSTSCISPAMFEEFCMGYTDRIADTVHPYGCRYVHHSCGLIYNLLDLYRQTRMDAVDALTLKPVGDIERISDAREKLGGRITIRTGIKVKSAISGSVLDNKNKVDELIAEHFADVAPGNNIVFSVGGSPELNMAELMFIVQTCKKYQRMYMS